MAGHSFLDSGFKTLLLFIHLQRNIQNGLSVVFILSNIDVLKGDLNSSNNSVDAPHISYK